MNILKTVAAAGALTVAMATSAFADATITVCTGPNGTNCATDRISLGRGKTVSQCVDGAYVTKSVSSLRGAASFNDAMNGLFNIATRAAEAVEARGVTVTGYQAEMDDCSGSWEPYCTAITVGEVNVEGTVFPTANRVIEALTNIEARGCGLFGPTHNLYPTPSQ